jgi:AmmeMemoRadiSam system protein B/AmmeMemoRadiSam system protein A
MAGIRPRAASGEPGREAAVAGQFYPGDAGSLRAVVESCLALGRRLDYAPRIIISPHAGYQYSGPVAGTGYAAIDSGVHTVILLGPPHYVPVHGIAVSSAAWFETPLGRVPLDREKIVSLLANPMVYVDDRAHGPEHSLEVQLPFLQARLHSFKIIPLLVSDADPRRIAGVILPFIDDHTLVVASSDLSHFLSQKEARIEDDRSIASIVADNIEGTIDACGELPIRVAMVLADTMGLKPRLLDARTSFETSPSSGSGRVVGYASIVYAPGPERVEPAGRLADDARRYLLTLARRTIEAAVNRTPFPAAQEIPDAVRENRGCFVTITRRGELRGCIGYIEPIRPLFQAAAENARNAALSDPRFPAVSSEELPQITLEISVLTKPVALEYKNPGDLLEKIAPGIDGIILQSGQHVATFLPQVWEQLPDKVQFLEQLSLKAGMARDGWKTAAVKRYRAEHFSE